MTPDWLTRTVPAVELLSFSASVFIDTIMGSRIMTMISLAVGRRDTIVDYRLFNVHTAAIVRLLWWIIEMNVGKIIASSP